MKTLLLAVFAMSLLMPIGAHAQDDITVQFMRNQCKQLTQGCLEFTSGIFEMMAIVASTQEDRSAFGAGGP